MGCRCDACLRGDRLRHEKDRYSVAPIVLTYVLGAMMEKALLQSVKMNNGSLIGLIESPISLFMLIRCDRVRQ